MTNTRLEAIRERLDAATPGHWAAGIEIEPEDGAYWCGTEVIAVDELPVPDYANGDDDEVNEQEANRISSWADVHYRGVIASTHNYFPIPDEQHDANQRLIGHAPDDLRYLLDRLTAAEGLCTAWEQELSFNNGEGPRPDLEAARAAWQAWL